MLTLWDLLKPIAGAFTPTREKPRRPALRDERSATDRTALQRAAPQQAAPLAPPSPSPRKSAVRRKPAPAARASSTMLAKQTSTATKPSKASMARKYEQATRLMLDKYNVRVRRWRTAMSGIAWYVTYRDGTIVRLIEAPKPKGPMSAAVFLHEIGHHAIGFDVYKPRCLEEYHAWKFAIDAMRELDLNITPAVERRMARSLKYAVAKARRRGLRVLPPELAPFA